MVKTVTTAAIVAALCLASVQMAAATGDFFDKAKVIRSSPIIETVDEPIEVCDHKFVKVQPNFQPRNNDLGNKLAGGIIGAAAGSAVGKGSGRDAAAGIGAVIGAEIADGDELNEGEVIGGIFGGIAGNQFGKGSGKTATTAAGALFGSILGGNLKRQNQHVRQNQVTEEYRKVRVCSNTYKQRKIVVGYDVDFTYQGRSFNTVLTHKPDRELDVNVSVLPVE